MDFFSCLGHSHRLSPSRIRIFFNEDNVITQPDRGIELLLNSVGNSIVCGVLVLLEH